MVMFGLKSLVIFSLIASLILIVIIYYVDKHPYKEIENKLSISQFIELYVNRYFHITLSFMVNLYVFFVRYNKIYDIIYLLISFIIVSHWFILGNGECWVSYREKNILDSTYMRGDSPKEEICIEILKSKYNDNNFITHIDKNHHLLFYINIAFVSFRLIYYKFFQSNKKSSYIL